MQLVAVQDDALQLPHRHLRVVAFLRVVGVLGLGNERGIVQVKVSRRIIAASYEQWATPRLHKRPHGTWPVAARNRCCRSKCNFKHEH